ncbi:hypothetical protein MKW92_045173 [Papaver armeniacum]|nr:hypothetical protein MKW92_045173 [Papaver armeniacum]
MKSHSMERYFKKKAKFADTSSNSPPSKRHCTRDGNASSSQPNTPCSQTNAARSEESDISVQVPQSDPSKSSGSSSIVLSEADLANLPSDPGLRKQIIEYHPNVRNQVRRAYLPEGTLSA